MPTPQQLLFIILLPACLAVVLGFLGWRVWRGGFAGGFWAGPLAVAGGFALGFQKVTQAPVWPINETTTWLFYIAIAAGLIGLLDALVKVPIVLRFILSYAICFAAAAMLLRFKLRTGVWTHGQFFATVSSLSIIGLMWWGAFERSMFRDVRQNSSPTLRRSVVGPLLMWMTATAGALAMNDSVTCSLWAANLAAISGALIVVSLLRPNIRWTRGTAFAFAPLMLSIIIAANYLGSPTRQQQVTVTFPLLATPVLILLGRLLAIPIPKHWARVAVRLAVPATVMVPLMVVGAIAIKHVNDEKQKDGDDPYAWQRSHRTPAPAQPSAPAYSDGLGSHKRIEIASTGVASVTI